MECAVVLGVYGLVTWWACGIGSGREWITREKDGSEPFGVPEGMLPRFLGAKDLVSVPHCVGFARLAQCIADVGPVA